MATDLWGMGHGVWGMGYGAWGMGYGVWGMGHGVWGMGYGVRGMGHMSNIQLVQVHALGQVFLAPRGGPAIAMVVSVPVPAPIAVKGATILGALMHPSYL